VYNFKIYLILKLIYLTDLQGKSYLWWTLGPIII